MASLDPQPQGLSQAAIQVFPSQGSTGEGSVSHITVGRIWFFMGCRFEGLSFLLTVGQRSP